MSARSRKLGPEAAADPDGPDPRPSFRPRRIQMRLTVSGRPGRPRSVVARPARRRTAGDVVCRLRAFAEPAPRRR